MAYSDIGDVTAGDPVTEAYLDGIRANFLASAPDAFTTKGDLFAATGADAGARVAVGADDSTLVADASQSAGLAWQIQPAARVYNSGDVAISATTWTTITFDAERFDTDTVHSTSSNTGRLTVPANGGGLYLIGANIEVTPASGSFSGSVGIQIVLNGATVIAQNILRNQSSSTSVMLSLVTFYALVATDYVTVQAYSTDNANAKATGNSSPEFWCMWQRRA